MEPLNGSVSVHPHKDGSMQQAMILAQKPMTSLPDHSVQRRSVLYLTPCQKYVNSGNDLLALSCFQNCTAAKPIARIPKMTKRAMILPARCYHLLSTNTSMSVKRQCWQSITYHHSMGISILPTAKPAGGRRCMARKEWCR